MRIFNAEYRLNIQLYHHSRCMSQSLQIGRISSYSTRFFFTKGHRVISCHFQREGLLLALECSVGQTVCKLRSFRIKEKEMAALFLSFQGDQHKHNTTVVTTRR